MDIPDVRILVALLYTHKSDTAVTYTDVAQDNIVPAAPTKSILPWLHSCRSAFGRYFVDVDMDEATGLGRLIPSRELQSAYPEDEQYGANWTHGWLE